MKQLELHEVSRLAREVLDEVEVAVVGKREPLDARARCDPRRWSRAARGLSRLGQDARRSVVRPDAGA